MRDAASSATILPSQSVVDEIKTFFAKLASGGQITSALKEEFWGGMFGTLTDKFGNEWLLNYEKPKKVIASTHRGKA